MDYLPTLGEKWPHSEGNVGKYSIHGSYGYLRHFGLDGSYTQQTIAALETLETQVVTCSHFEDFPKSNKKTYPLRQNNLYIVIVHPHCKRQPQNMMYCIQIIYIYINMCQ